MPLEMQVSEDFSLAPIGWNYEQLKAQIAEAVEPYQGMIITPASIPTAKSDVARLRKLSKTLNDRKIDIHKQCEKPYKVFEGQVKDVISVIDSAIANIDSQIKEFEAAEKKIKRVAIESFFNVAIGDLRGFVAIDRIWNDKWLNAGYKTPEIQAEISAIINRLRDDVDMVKGMNSPHVTELLHTLFSTLDLSAVIRHQQALESLSKTIEPSAEHLNAEPPQPVPALPQATESIDTPEPVEAITIRLYLTKDNKRRFKEFCMMYEIQYERA